MSNTNEQSIDFYKKFQEIKYDMSKASLEDVKNILDHYNQGAIEVNDVNYHYNINPLDAACLNARYKQLTGQDHPTFISEQGKVLDEIIKSGEGISVDGKPTIYQRLKNNLTGEGLGISILPNKKDSYIDKFDAIKFDMSQASLDDIKDILDHYDQDSVLIDGMQYHFRPNALQGASLNARYKELTGQNHPVFTEQAPKVIDDLMKDKDMLIQAGAYGTDYFDKLEQIKQGTQQTTEIQSNEESKKVFTEERDKQRQLDASVRTQQITAMQQANQNTQEMQQMVSETTQDNSIGGMSR